jgi:cytochrome c
MFKFSALTKFTLGFSIPFVIAAFGYVTATALFQTQGQHGDAHVAQEAEHAEEAVQKEEPKAEVQAEPEPEAEPDFAELVAAGDVEKGAKVFGKCKACHKLEMGKNAVGPYLVGIVGRPVATAEGFSYSAEMQELGGEWTPELLNEFLIKPKALVPKTKMSFAGLKKIDQRADLIAYLATITE